jgi:hypothetical protein
MPRGTTRCQDATLVQLGDDSAVDSEAMRSAVLISRLQRHHPVEIDQLVMPVEKLAYLQRRDVP